MASTTFLLFLSIDIVSEQPNVQPLAHTLGHDGTDSFGSFQRQIVHRKVDNRSFELQNGIILFPGNGESPMNYADNWYPFKQDSSFLYYTGIDHILQGHISFKSDIHANRNKHIDYTGVLTDGSLSLCTHTRID